MAFGIRHFYKSTHIAHLWRIVNCFYITTYPWGIVWILTIVTKQMGNSLLHTSTFIPIPNKLREILLVHKRNMVNMAICLSHKNYSGRDTLLTRSLRVRLMIIFAIIVDLIFCRWYESTVWTFRIFWVWFCASFLALEDLLIEWNMLDVSCCDIIRFNFRLCWCFLRFRLFVLARCFCSCVNLYCSVSWWHRLRSLLFFLLNDCSHDYVSVSNKNCISMFDASLS